MKILENKCGMIVGATSGIGRAAALLFAKEGAKVVIVGRRTELLTTLCAEIEQQGGCASVITADISQSSEIVHMVKEAKRILGRIDFAFNNAGTIGNFAPMLEQSEQDWDTTIDTNLKSIWLSIREQSKAMAESGGAIVNTSSWLANGGLVGSTTYSASKAGMDGLLRPAALELAELNIRINNINPGGVDTEMTREAFQHDEETLDAFGKAHPIGRMGTVTEIADLAVFLVSDRSTNITGQAIVIDGGYAIGGQRG
jgi:NAD(P)-dependent dehydrogenase (short-subunit alcohol dehydrogenase family)